MIFFVDFENNSSQNQANNDEGIDRNSKSLDDLELDADMSCLNECIYAAMPPRNARRHRKNASGSTQAHGTDADGSSLISSDISTNSNQSTGIAKNQKSNPERIVAGKPPIAPSSASNSPRKGAAANLRRSQEGILDMSEMSFIQSCSEMGKSGFTSSHLMASGMQLADVAPPDSLMEISGSSAIMRTSNTTEKVSVMILEKTFILFGRGVEDGGRRRRKSMRRRGGGGGGDAEGEN